MAIAAPARKKSPTASRHGSTLANRSPKPAHPNSAPALAPDGTACPCGGVCPRCAKPDGSPSGGRNLPSLIELPEVPFGSGLLQRKCACGGASGSNGECEECREDREKRLQRHPASATEPKTVPPLVHDVLGSPGRPLDSATRAFLEPQFGHDFSRVRVHADARAAESARAVNALAYTVGRDVVFDAGQYSPTTKAGRSLLAHELTHVVQQAGSTNFSPSALKIDPPSSADEREASRNANAVNGSVPPAAGAPSSPGRALLQRACLSADECKTDTGSLSTFVAETTAKPENVSKAAQRKKHCNKKPPDAECTSDGHGAHAVETENLLRAYDATRLAAVTGIFVDKDIPADFGAYTLDCNAFTPPIKGGGEGIFIPELFEKQAAQFNNTKDATIGGEERGAWRALRLEILGHETGHARFDAQKIEKPRPVACSFASIKNELSEIAAIMNGFEVAFDLLQSSNLSEAEREAKLHEKFSFWITNPSESISGTLRKIRCTCECADADAYVRSMVDLVTANWSLAAKRRFHLEMKKPEWSAAKLKWPVEPPPPPPSTTVKPPPPQPTKSTTPLFKPRTDFNQKVIDSAKDL